ncbi:ABC transporter substrate-binding protein [Chondrinema litorale]|uniref:ABC transporter substrate-binding protein n=1 Tax=Chondrinema litorale TaxID=2994555 RepID=UPI002542B3BB|nr:ABC transporter substrate-binding protein [Chondrinema litorale]UZR98033.1 ABC transporter substrate-binding protein [Chondrinema litorale]
MTELKGLKYPYNIYTIFFSILAFLFSCSNDVEQNNSSPNQESQTFEWKQPSIEFASGFSLEYSDTYKILDVFSPFQDAEDTLHYILVPEGNAVPDQFKTYQKITIPVKRMVLTSTTHIAMVAYLEKLNAVSGITDSAFIYSPKVKQLLESGKIKEVGKNGALNNEVIIAANTDLVISGAWSSAAFETYRPLIDAGIPVMINAEWTESHPLGRMEWIKVFGALFNMEDKAEVLFNKSKTQYLELANKTRDVVEKPSVINGTPYQEAWSIAGGNSYVGTLFKDAGADWHWANDTSQVSYQLDFESVYPIGLEADYWISPGRATDLTSLQTIDERFKDFKSYKEQKIFNFHNRANKNGMYDYYESGVVKPEVILADLIKILHPDLIPEHELYYFKKVE